MSTLNIPGDIKKFVLKTVLKRIAHCVFLLIGVLIVLSCWGDVILPIDQDDTKIIVYTIIMTLPFISTGVPFKLIDSTWEGKIVDVKVIEGSEFTNEPRPRIYGSNSIALKVITQDNKIKIVKLKVSSFAIRANLQFRETGNVDKSIESYSVGNKIFHLYGTNQYVVLPKPSDKNINCIVCGTENDKFEKKCKNCGCSLINRSSM